MKSLRQPLAASLLGLSLLLAACGSEDKAEDPKAGADPAVADALGDRIMVDPDLTTQNPGNAGLQANGPASAALPPQDRTPEAIAAARAEAIKLVGALQAAPAANGGAAADGKVTPSEIAAQAMGSAAGCDAKIEYSAGWASRLPAEMAVYPRGHVTEAAGTDRDGCRLRVVSFVTAVAVKDVLDFYFTRLKDAGYDAQHRADGGDSVLSGKKGSGAAYVVFVRQGGDGLTEVDLVSNGG